MELIHKAVIAVAGKGSRMMPLTLHQPKAMIGIIDRPIIHYIVDEIIAAGIREIIIITGPDQPEFKKYVEYLQTDSEWKKFGVKFYLTIQKKARGNGNAILSAEKLIGNEPFILCFGDDLLADKTPLPQRGKPPLKNLVELYKKIRSPILTLERVPWNEVSKYGVVETIRSGGIKTLKEIKNVVEKPPPEKAPSNLTIIGRYVITPDFFSLVREVAKSAPKGKEIYLTDAFNLRLKRGNKIFGWKFDGKRFDCGSKLGLLKANVYFGTHHSEYKKDFRNYLKSFP